MEDKVMGYGYGCAGVCVGFFDQYLCALLPDLSEGIVSMNSLYYYVFDHFHHGFCSHY